MEAAEAISNESLCCALPANAASSTKFRTSGLRPMKVLMLTMFIQVISICVEGEALRRAPTWVVETSGY